MSHHDDCHECRLEVLENYLRGAELSSNILDLIQLVIDDRKVELSSPAIGHNYIQFRDQATPADLYPGTSWENISHLYEGRFFRAEGGEAAQFGQVQDGGLPNITGTLAIAEGATWGYVSGAFYSVSGIAYEDPDNGNHGAQVAHFSAQKSNSLYGASNEVRPINETFRIWKRTA